MIVVATVESGFESWVVGAALLLSYVALSMRVGYAGLALLIVAGGLRSTLPGRRRLRLILLLGGLAVLAVDVALCAPAATDRTGEAKALLAAEQRATPLDLWPDAEHLRRAPHYLFRAITDDIAAAKGKPTEPHWWRLRGLVGELLSTDARPFDMDKPAEIVAGFDQVTSDQKVTAHEQERFHGQARAAYLLLAHRNASLLAGKSQAMESAPGPSTPQGAPAATMDIKAPSVAPALSSSGIAPTPLSPEPATPPVAP